MGFSAEIKDFVNAYGAGKKIQQGDQDAAYKKLRSQRLQQQIDLADDPRYKDLSMQRLKSQVDYFNARAARRPDPELTRSRQIQNDLRQKQLDLLNTPQPGAADDAAPMAPPTGPRSALDVNSNVADAGTPTGTTGMGDPTATAPTMYSATGGPVTRKGYSDGGEVDDDEEPETPDASDITPQQAAYQDAQDASDDEGDEEPAGALPVGRVSPTAPTRGNAGPVEYSNEAGHDAALAGVKFAAKATGHDGSSDSAVTMDLSARSKGSTRYLSGHGAMSQDDFNAVADKVDPEHTLPEAQRNMATLATKYMWDLKHKGPHEADAAAASMTQYMRMASDRYKAIAAAAAAHGDLDGTMQNMVRSYANIPTGSDLKLTKTPEGHVNWSITDDKTGKQVQGGLLTPDELLGWATKGGMPSFDSLLAQSASGRAELAAKEKAANKGTKGYKAKDRETADAAVDASVAALPKADAYKDELPEIKGSAFQLQGANPNVNKDDILSSVIEMTRAGSKLAATPAPGGVNVKRANGQTVFVPDELIPRLKNARDLNTKNAADAEAKSKSAGDRMAGVVGAIKNIVTPGVHAAPPAYGNPLQELHDQGRVSGAPIAPAPAMSTIDRINMARRTQGLPPLPASALPVNAGR